MCSTFKVGNRSFSPGNHIIINTLNGYNTKMWSVGRTYNARVENMRTTWEIFKPVYAEISSFFEGRALFDLSNTTMFPIACLMTPLNWSHSQQGILVITKPSKGTIIEPFHLRMPVLLKNPEEFMSRGYIKEIDYNLLELVA